jgi:hypothetical protein
MSVADNLGKITVIHLKDICKRHIQLSQLECRTRANLYTAILGQSIQIQDTITAEVNSAIQNGHEKYKRKNKESDNEPGTSKRPRLNPEIVKETVPNGEKLFVYRKE